MQRLEFRINTIKGLGLILARWVPSGAKLHFLLMKNMHKDAFSCIANKLLQLRWPSRFIRLCLLRNKCAVQDEPRKQSQLLHLGPIKTKV